MSLEISAQDGQLVTRFLQITLLTIAIGLFSSAAMAEKINLNLADEETLQYIPGIGPSKSADIVKTREKLGNFKQYEDLLEVPGIGEKTLGDIKEYGVLEGGISKLTKDMLENPPAPNVTTSDSNAVQTSS